MRDDQKTCQLLFPWFEKLYGATFMLVSIPEDDKCEAPDARIDLSAFLDGRMFAFEHTRVGPYTGYETDQKEAGYAEQVINGIGADLEEDENLDFVTPPNFLAYLPKKPKHDFFRMMCHVGRQELANLRAGFSRKTYYTSIVRSIDGHEVIVRYRRSQSGLRGLTIRLTAGTNLDVEVQRLKRFIEKLPAKLDKLGVWGRRGATTVLVLEDRYVQLSNEELVGSAVKVAIENHESAPDFVFYVDATYPRAYMLLPLCERGQWNMALYTDASLPRFYEVPAF